MKENITRMTHNMGQAAITCRFCSKFDYRFHAHDFYEFQTVLSGGGTHYLNAAEYELKRGHAVFMRLTDCHQKIMTDDFSYLIIQVHPGDMPQQILRRFTLFEGDLVTDLDEKELSYIESLARLLKDCCDGKYADSENMKQNLIELIFSLFLNSVCTSPATLGPTADRFSEMLIYIKENFRNNICSREVAEKFFMNNSYFCEYFKKNSGQTFSSYLRSVRLDHAANLAVMTDMSVSRIAEDSGFKTVSHFLRCFKDKFGMTPMEMRKCRRNI